MDKKINTINVVLNSQHKPVNHHDILHFMNIMNEPIE